MSDKETNKRQTEESKEREELLAAIQRRLPSMPLRALRAVLGLLWGWGATAD